MIILATLTVTIDWGVLITSCITASVVGAVTGITNWLLNRHFLRRLEKLEDKIAKRKKEEEENVK